MPSAVAEICLFGDVLANVGFEAGCSSSAALLAMLLSIDRFIALKYPFQYTGLCTYTEFGVHAVAKRAFSYAEFLTRFAIPLTVMTVSNTWTLLLICRSDKYRHEVDAETKIAPNTKCLALTVGVVVIFFIIQVPRAGYLIDLMIYFNDHRTLFYYEVFILFCNLWSKLNSLANIFIYFVLSE
ncbi:hypothetical protein CAPTEDRAFT_213224 [Capitella teleta]|uniref:G-protein coupled receptors family 1 profile domain-containing protein n=1 Tax=Capitella teleta TaxID=283909 RepID=R7UPG6_CAPTE|nr:hypothetical protein CAPTEDRAFT_213224 [Capitella teleta]|eukprot:ELU08419.1 hypothetical protein CAPTEDRAFT_213224 [Capitella teleta]